MRDKTVAVVVGLMAATIAYACWCRLPLIWDGAYQFNATLIRQFPYAYLTRFHTYLIWWPTVAASRYTTNVDILQTIYGLPFLLAPLIGVAGSWWMVRKDAPSLMLWPMFGICAAILPGQVFVINDSIFQLNLFWPIYMGLFVPLSPGKKCFLAILMVFQYVHQIGVVLLFGAAATAGLVAIFDRENRAQLLTRMLLLLSLFLLGCSKLLLTNTLPPTRDYGGILCTSLAAPFFIAAMWLTFAGSTRWIAAGLATLVSSAVVGGLIYVLRVYPDQVSGLYDTYAQSEAGWLIAKGMWRMGVRGWPLAGLFLMYASAFLAAAQEDVPRHEHSRRTPFNSPGYYAIVLVSLALVLGIVWASNGRFWWKALDYRRWVVPISLPAFMLATWEGCRRARLVRLGSPPDSSEKASYRSRLALLLGCVFAIILSIQSTVWHNETNRLLAAVSDSKDLVVPTTDLPWISMTPLDHWGSSDFIVAMQGKKPKKLLLDTIGEENLYANPPVIPHYDVYPNPPNPGPAGWYDFTDILKAVAADHGHVVHKSLIEDRATRPR